VDAPIFRSLPHYEIDLSLSSFLEKMGRPVLMNFFVVVKKSTEGDIGYLKLSRSILIQNGGASKSCLLHCVDPVQRTGSILFYFIKPL
jgi:hypothetical protein